MKVFCCYLKDALSKKFSSTPTYWFEKRRDIHFVCKIPISKYESFDRLTDFISNECENRNIFFDDHKMIYPRLISSFKWKICCQFTSRRETFSMKITTQINQYDIKK